MTVEPSGNKIFVSGLKIEFNKFKTEGDALLIPWNNIKFFGCSSSDLIAFNKSVSSFLTIISPFSLSINVFINNSSTLVDFEIIIFLMSKPNTFAI